MPNVPRALVPKTYRFKRDLEETLILSASSPPDGWAADGSKRIYRNMGFALGVLGDVSDFTNLFRQYRIKGARVRIYFSNTQSGLTHIGGSNTTFSNSQMLVRLAPNQSGQVQALDDAYWQSIQAKKYRTAFNGGRPVDMYMPLKLRDEVEASSGGTATVLARPKFVPTAATNVLFEGVNIAIERVDGQTLSTGATNNYQYAKMITTLYFECRGVE